MKITLDLTYEQYDALQNSLDWSEIRANNQKIKWRNAEPTQRSEIEIIRNMVKIHTDEMWMLHKLRADLSEAWNAAADDLAHGTKGKGKAQPADARSSTPSSQVVTSPSPHQSEPVLDLTDSCDPGTATIYKDVARLPKLPRYLVFDAETGENVTSGFAVINKKSIPLPKHPILDACCGGRQWHFDKANEQVEFMGIREIARTALCDGRGFEVKPTTVGDFTKMPFEDESFLLVLFDPPHRSDLGEGCWLEQRFGNLSKDKSKALGMLRAGFNECWRVLAPGGVLFFKWSDSEIKLGELKKRVFPVMPVAGSKAHSMSGRDNTFSLVFWKPLQP